MSLNPQLTQLLRQLAELPQQYAVEEDHCVVRDGWLQTGGDVSCAMLDGSSCSLDDGALPHFLCRGAAVLRCCVLQAVMHACRMLCLV
jgi:hypothetical protein